MVIFGARYYDSDLSVWLSVDPMASSRSWISPYNYCQWNPVGRVDPSGALDGLNDDGYTVDLQGNIEWVDYTGGDNYDVIFNKADYEAGKREYDETGTKNGIKIFRKEVVDFKVGVIPIYEYQNEVPTDETTSYKLVLNNPETAEKVFSFFSRNAGVEYSNEYYSKGDETLNIIFTANMPGTVPGNYVRAQKYKKAGWTLRRFDHSHPNNDPNPSDYGWESGDLPNKDSIMSLFPGIEILFNVYTPGNNKYNPY